MESASDTMREIAGFLEEYELCVQDQLDTASDAVVASDTAASDSMLSVSDVIDQMASAGDEDTQSTEAVIAPVQEDATEPSPPPNPNPNPNPSPFPSPPTSTPPPPHQNSTTTTTRTAMTTGTTVASKVTSVTVDQYLRDIDGVIKMSREAQDSVLTLANGLQDLFHSVMVERNHAVDDLKKSVSLLRYSVGELQKMRGEMSRMVDRESAVAAREAAVEGRLAQAERLETDVARRLQDVAAKEATSERQIAEYSRRLEEVASREAVATEREAAADRVSTDLEQRMHAVVTRESAVKAEELSVQVKLDRLAERRSAIDARTEELAEREQAVKTELFAWNQTLQEREAVLHRIESDVTRLAKEKVIIETDRRQALEGVQAARDELEATEARLRALKAQADEIEAVQEPTRLALESERAEIQSIRQERESFEALKRDIVVQGHRAIESAERCRAEQMTLALIKRDSIQKASQLFVNHLEAAMEFGSSPEFLCNLRALLHRHFHGGVQGAGTGGGIGDLGDLGDLDDPGDTVCIGGENSVGAFPSSRDKYDKREAVDGHVSADFDDFSIKAVVQ